jgi:hypothetical protein
MKLQYCTHSLGQLSLKYINPRVSNVTLQHVIVTLSLRGSFKVSCNLMQGTFDRSSGRASNYNAKRCASVFKI